MAEIKKKLNIKKINIKNIALLFFVMIVLAVIGAMTKALRTNLKSDITSKVTNIQRAYADVPACEGCEGCGEGSAGAGAGAGAEGSDGAGAGTAEASESGAGCAEASEASEGCEM